MNIIIFGTGEFGKDAYRYYEKATDINILAFCDNDTKKQGQLFFDKNIISINTINNYSYDKIIIASSFDDEIFSQLINQDFEKNKIEIISLNKIKKNLKEGDTLALAEELMLNISILFNKEHINYHIDHGTLLGIIRDSSLMPWDIDVDFACKSEDKDLILSMLNHFFKDFKSSYCKNNNWQCSIENCDITIQNTKENLPMVIKVFNNTDDINSDNFFVDIELKYEYNNNLYWMVGSRKLFTPVNICFPTSSILFKNTPINIPNNVNEYLRLLYGNWDKVIKEWSYDKYNNIKDKI